MAATDPLQSEFDQVSEALERMTKRVDRSIECVEEAIARIDALDRPDPPTTPERGGARATVRKASWSLSLRVPEPVSKKEG
jgi:hypothetical protein